ncbi:MAG: M14 family zinc carboxypeptidase [bacterium]
MLIILVFIAATFSLTTAQVTQTTYSQVRLYIDSPNDFSALGDAGLSFGHIHYQGNYFDAVLNHHEIELLRETATRFEILVADLEAEYRSRPKLSQPALDELEADMRRQLGVQGFGFGSMGGYYTFAEVVQELDNMLAKYPGLISQRQSLGTSIEGRDLWMVKISDNPNIDENEEEILYTGLHHAREPQSMATTVYFMWYLLENYGSDPTVTFLVDNRELYFMPVVNPDGYVYNELTNPNGGGFWRKNRRNNGDGSFGVDLNRNYGYKWGFDNIGSSPNPSSSTYRGTAAFSEPATQIMRDFAISREFTMAYNYHSYGNLLIFPWGYIANFFTDDHALFVSLSQNMIQFNNYTFGTANQTVGYLVNGEANDWFYGEQTLKGKVLGFTPEVGNNFDGFWPNQNRIFPIADENVYPNLVLAMGLSGGAPPTITLTLQPANPPITIPPGGGAFSYEVTGSNGGTSTMSGQVWTMVALPNGSQFGPTIGPLNVTIGAGQSRNANFTENVPANALAGNYIYTFYFGTFGGPVISSASFTFSKSATALAAKSDIIDSALPMANVPKNSFAQGVTPRNWHELLPKSGAASLPDEFTVEQNYPNPFNPATVIRYGLNRDARVSVKVYNLLGEEIAILVDAPQTAGYQSVRWNGKNSLGRPAPAGIYVYRIEANSMVETRKMILAK